MQTTYEIKKETKPNGEIFYKLFINNILEISCMYVVNNNYTGKDVFIGKEENAIPLLTKIINTHKETGSTTLLETVYSEQFNPETHEQH